MWEGPAWSSSIERREALTPILGTNGDLLMRGAATTDLYKGRYAMHNETLGGLAPPLAYTEGKPHQIRCFFTVSIKNGGFVAASGAKPICPTSSLTSGSTATS